MSSTRKILKIFVASPSDLQEERKAVRDVAQEFNELWAEQLGYHVELLGWEDTLPGVGRPQHLINRDLDACVFFIGMLWKRWGTPPSDDGKYTSGFEEEYDRSMKRFQAQGTPEIALFFKHIREESKIDPGPGLLRVLEFRRTIESERKVLYKTFSSGADIRRLARRSITHFVRQIMNKEASDEPRQIGATRTSNVLSERETQPDASKSPQIADEALVFLEKLTGEFRKKGGIGSVEAPDVARFRLLGNCVSTTSNDARNLGVHDSNLLFAEHISGMRFSSREALCLTQLGFQRLKEESVPLWSWYAMLSNTPYDPALYASLYGENDEEKVGAISVLRLLGREISAADGSPTKEHVVEKWFSKESESSVRIAALEYFKEMGSVDDVAVAKKEFDRNEIATSRAALECMIGISLRHEKYGMSRQLLLESQFESLDIGLLNAVLDSFDDLDTTTLQLGLEHNSKRVRHRAVATLRGRGFVDIQLAEQLARHSDATIRQEAIWALQSLGKMLSDDEIKAILTEPKGSPPFRGLIGSALSANGDPEGEALFAQYELEQLKRLSESELTARVELSAIFEDAPYFARAEGYFERFGDELRNDVDDKFFAYFNTHVNRLLETPVGKGVKGKEFIKRLRNLEDFHRKKLTRLGLNVLCRTGEAQDLHRVRLNLQTGFTESSTLDIEYLGKRGDWADISVLAQAKAPISSEYLLEPNDREDFCGKVAKIVLKLGRNKSISRLFGVEFPTDVLARVIELCSDSRFSRVSDKALLDLFDCESSSVRRAASVKAVRSLPSKRIKSILHKYVNREAYRYYNVIHWLDLGSSMTRDNVRKVTNCEVG